MRPAPRTPTPAPAAAPPAPSHWRRGAIPLALALALGAAPLRAEPTPPAAWGPLTLLGRHISPGEREKLTFDLLPSFAASFLDTVVVVLRGRTAGPMLCVTAGVHGDELNGVEIARRVVAETDPQQLAGTLIVVPVVNAAGFRAGRRDLPDGRDLNRAFPGSASGGSAARMAHALFAPVIRPCDALVDLHAGSPARLALPQIRTDLSNPEALALARAFGAAVVLDGAGPPGSLRRAALDTGVPAVVYVAGAPRRFEADEITLGTQGIRRVMAHLGMLAREPAPPAATVYRHARWVRVPSPAGALPSSPPPLEIGRAHV